MCAIWYKTIKSLINFHDVYEKKQDSLLLTILHRQISTSLVHTICESYKCKKNINIRAHESLEQEGWEGGDHNLLHKLSPNDKSILTVQRKLLLISYSPYKHEAYPNERKVLLLGHL